MRVHDMPELTLWQKSSPSGCLIIYSKNELKFLKVCHGIVDTVRIKGYAEFTWCWHVLG